MLEHADLPLAFWDERLSTAAVEREMIAADLSRKRRAEIIDKVAAAYILQGLLDRIGRRRRAAIVPWRAPAVAQQPRKPAPFRSIEVRANRWEG